MYSLLRAIQYFFITILLPFTTGAQLATPAMISMSGLGGDQVDQLFSKYITPTSDGFIVSIQTNSKTTGNLNTSCSISQYSLTNFRKYNSTGDILEWEKCDQDFFCIASGYNDTFLFGRTKVNSTTPRDIDIKKEDSLGGILWNKTYGGSSDDKISGIISSKDGHFYIVGEAYSNDGDVGAHYGSQFLQDFWIFKIDGAGTILWSKVLGGSSQEQSPYIVPTADGGVYLIGTTESVDNHSIGNHGIQDVFVARLDDTGNIKWTKCFGGCNNDYAKSAVINAQGNLLVTASTKSSDGDVKGHFGQMDCWVLEVDISGNLVWEQCYGTANGDEYANTINVSTDGSIWLGGQHNALNSWIFRLSSTGNVLSEKKFNVDGFDEAAVSHPLPNGFMLIGGRYDTAGSQINEMPTNFYGSRDVYLAVFAPWTTIIGDIQSREKARVFPNPSSDWIAIYCNENDKLNVTVCDIVGQIKYKQRDFDSYSKIDVSNWSHGTYIVNAIDQYGQSFSDRLVIK